MESKRVVLVDNDEIDLVITKQILDNNNMASDISMFRSGWELIHFLSSNEPIDYPDYVLLDFKMPGQTGLQVLDELKVLLDKNEVSHLPRFIISTCSTDFEDLKAIQKNNMVDGFMYKPVNPERLSEILATFE